MRIRQFFSPFFFLWICLGIMLAALQAHAQEAKEAQEAPDVMVKRITREVMDAVRSDRAIKAGDRQRIHALVESRIAPHVDIERATALAMGRYWRQVTPAQKEKLIKEVRTLLLYTYAGGLSQVGDQELVFKPMRAEPGDTEVEVRFEVRQKRGAEPVQVSYRLYKAPDGWKVYDVNVLGVWLGQTYRSSFAAEIERSGIDGLIAILEEKNRKFATTTEKAGT